MTMDMRKFVVSGRKGEFGWWEDEIRNQDVYGTRMILANLQSF